MYQEKSEVYLEEKIMLYSCTIILKKDTLRKNIWRTKPKKLNYL